LVKQEGDMRQRNLDDLAKMSDDDIRNLLRSSKDEILRLEKSQYRSQDFSKHKTLKLLQVEYCYIKREAEIRKERHNAHRMYLRDNNTRYRNKAF